MEFVYEATGSDPSAGGIGVSEPPNTEHVHSAQSPTEEEVILEEALETTSQGIEIGASSTQEELNQDLTGAIDPTDQTTDVQAEPASGAGISSTADLTVNMAKLAVDKSANKSISFVDDTITYTITIKNTGNLPADSVIITDQIPNGTLYELGSVTANVPFTGVPTSSIKLTNPVGAGQTVIISFVVLVNKSPNPNPVRNIATVNFKYTVDPENPDGVSATVTATSSGTVIFQNNYTQQINDLIESIALEEAAIANILNAEGAKIQKFVAMPNVTPEMLLCLNKSVQEMTDATTILEAILRQKLSSVECQINGDC